MLRWTAYIFRLSVAGPAERALETSGVFTCSGRMPTAITRLQSRHVCTRCVIRVENARWRQHYAEFLRVVGAGIADGRIRYLEDIVDYLEKA